MEPGDPVRTIKRHNLMPQKDLQPGEVGIVHHIDPRRNECSIQFVGRLLLWCIPLDVVEVISQKEFEGALNDH